MKKLWNFVPSHILLWYALGVLFQFQWSIGVPLFHTLFLCFVLLIFFQYVWKSYLLIGFIAFLLGIQAICKQQSRFNVDSEHENLVVIIDRVLKSSMHSERYYAELRPKQANGISKRILFSVEKDSTRGRFEIGDVLLVRGSPKETEAAKNPYGFDYKAYLKTKRIETQLYIRKGGCLQVSAPVFSIMRMASRLRATLVEDLQNTIEDVEVWSVTVAILLGDRRFVSKDNMANFSNAGIIHLLAVSGLHVGIFNYLLFLIFKPLELFFRKKWVSLLFVLIGLWVFAFVAGLSASVVRAVTMFSFVSVGMFMKQLVPIGFSLVSSALLLLLFDPYLLFDLGFQMSYLAVISIVVLQPLIYGFWKPKYKVARYFWSLATVSLAAQMGVLPLSLYYFHQFPILFLVSNLLVIPCIGILLVTGVVVLVWSVLGGGDSPIVSIYEFVVRKLNQYVTWVGEKEIFVSKNIYFSEAMMVTSYFVLIAILMGVYTRRVKYIYLVLSTVLLFQLVCLYEKSKQMSTERLVIFHQYKESLVAQSTDGQTASWGVDSKKSNRNLNNYWVDTGLPVTQKYRNTRPFYQIKDQLLFVVDKAGVYEVQGLNGGFVMLKDTPRINFERLLHNLQPSAVIADASNYNYVKEKWRSTCAQQNIPFWDTSVLGAYVFGDN